MISMGIETDVAMAMDEDEEKDGRKIDEDNGIDRGGGGQERKKEQNKQS